MLGFLLDAVGCLFVGAIAIHSVVLHLRLGRFRVALDEVGQVLTSFDASVNQIAEMANGFTARMMADLQTVEGRVAAARRLGVELAAASRTAEDAAMQLQRLLRQHKRVEAVRATTLPRELVEPKGFAARAGLPPVSSAPDAAPTAAPATMAEQSSSTEYAADTVDAVEEGVAA